MRKLTEQKTVPAVLVGALGAAAVIPAFEPIENIVGTTPSQVTVLRDLAEEPHTHSEGYVEVFRPNLIDWQATSTGTSTFVETNFQRDLYMLSSTTVLTIASPGKRPVFLPADGGAWDGESWIDRSKA
jgi:hypothetical protein